jgi:hypothetical protein
MCYVLRARQGKVVLFNAGPGDLIDISRASGRLQVLYADVFYFRS